MCKKTKKKKTKKLFRNFAGSYLGIGWRDLLQIWYVDSPSWGASLQQVWLNSGEWSQTYIGVKITFFVFLSIHSQCDATASWAARHTIVCLDIMGCSWLIWPFPFGATLISSCSIFSSPSDVLHHFSSLAIFFSFLSFFSCSFSLFSSIFSLFTSVKQWIHH